MRRIFVTRGVNGPELLCLGMASIYATEEDYDFFAALYDQWTVLVKTIGNMGGENAATFLQKAKDDPVYESEEGFKNAVNMFIEHSN